MSKMKIEMSGFGKFRLSFPKSDNYACDGVFITGEEMRTLSDMIDHILSDPDNGAYTTGGWEA